jgi:hypothetical protein
MRLVIDVFKRSPRSISNWDAPNTHVIDVDRAKIYNIDRHNNFLDIQVDMIFILLMQAV